MNDYLITLRYRRAHWSVRVYAENEKEAAEKAIARLRETQRYGKITFLKCKLYQEVM